MPAIYATEDNQKRAFSAISNRMKQFSAKEIQSDIDAAQEEWREMRLFEQDSVRELAQFYDDLEREEHMRITTKQAILLTAIVDFVGGLVAVLIGQFAPEWSAFALSIWGICQPLALSIIGYLVVEPVRELLQALRRLK